MRHLVVGTAGHIDHGKSTLVRALTGVDPDRLKEEKARGITIELGFAHTVVDDVTIAFVDVPGHERFVKTMLAGAGGIDAVMLVIAADESVMPQTREHFDICRLLQVRHGVVVLTKSDLVDTETLELVRLETRELIEGSFLETAPIVAVSAQTGAGLDELRALCHGLAAQASRAGHDGAARLPIDRAFTIQGFGTVVTGTLVSGRLRPDDELMLVPGDTRVRVRGVQVHGERRDEAVTGQRAAINLGGIEVSAIRRGQTLAAPESLSITRRADVTLELLPTARPLRHGTRVRFHQGTSEVIGRVSMPEAAMEPGTRGAARVRLEAPAALLRGDRFILRAYSPAVTIGGGVVLDPDPPRLGVRSAAAPQRFAALAGDTPGALAQMIRDAQGGGLRVRALVARAGVAPEKVETVAAALCAEGHARRAGDRLVAPPMLEDAARRLLALVAAFHQAHPIADGMPREEARERVFARADPAVFDLVVQELAAAGRLLARDTLALPGHRIELSPEEERARSFVESAFQRAGLSPPDMATLVREGRLSTGVADKVVTLLLRQKRLARVDALIFHADTLQLLKSQIQSMKTAAPGSRVTVDVATFKERYGVTRKFAIPLLEWLDRERVTRRMGDTRIVL